MIVLKDKKDIKFAPKDFLSNYKWESHGQYDSLDFVNPYVKILSVQFNKVGEKTFDGFSFNDLMEYGANSKKGKMYFKTFETDSSKLFFIIM